MKDNSPTLVFLIRGAHISENLTHHKASDVVRILEEKGFEKTEEETAALTGEPGFKETAGETAAAVTCFVHQDGSDNGSRTVVLFGEGDFVLKEDGVKFYEE